MERLVRGQTLANLLGVDRSTLYRWEQKGLLRQFQGVPGEEVHYLESEVNRMLLAAPNTTRCRLTYAALANGRVALVTKREASEQTGLTASAVETQLAHRRLAGVQVGRYWRITQSSIDHYMRVVLYTPQMVGHIIGMRYNRNYRGWLAHLIEQGELTKHHFSGRSGLFITAESLDTYLRAHLPPWVIPAEWREQRLDDLRPLLTLQAAATRLNRRHRWSLSQALEAERVGYIWLPGRRIRRYSPTAFDTYMDLERGVTPTEVGHWFGVHPTAVYRWRAGLSLVHCPLPGHYHKPLEPLYEACWAAIIQPQLSQGMNANAWIAYRKRSKAPLLGRILASAKLGIPPDEVTRLAETGALKGICTLTGEWRFSTHAIRRTKAALRRGDVG